METEKARREAELAEKAKDGDASACGELVMMYYPLINSIALKQSPKTSRFEVEDLVNQCIVILMHRSMRAFDRKKASFCTWIHFQIRSAIAQVIRETNSVGKAKIKSAEVFSQIGNDRGEMLASQIPARPENVCLARSIDQMCMRLDGKRSSVLRMRAKGLTLQQVADHMGISKERARQLERDAINELKEVYAGCESPDDMPDIVEAKDRSLIMQETYAGNGSTAMTIASMIETIATDEGLDKLDQEIATTEKRLAKLKSLRRAFGKPAPKGEAKNLGVPDPQKEKAIIGDIKKHGSSLPGAIAARTGLTPIGVGRTVASSSHLSKDKLGKVVLVAP